MKSFKLFDKKTGIKLGNVNFEIQDGLIKTTKDVNFTIHSINYCGYNIYSTGDFLSLLNDIEKYKQLKKNVNYKINSRAHEAVCYKDIWKNCNWLLDCIGGNVNFQAVNINDFCKAYTS